MQPKTKCDYCNGVTFDDDKGNCVACGAPRNDIHEQSVLHYPLYLIDNMPTPYIFPNGVIVSVCAST